MQSQAAKLFNGEHKADRLNPNLRGDGKPDKPDDLDSNAERLWETAIEPLINQGVVTSLDQGSLEMLCIWFSAFHKIAPQVRDLEDFTTTAAQRCLNALKNAAGNFNVLAKHFGLTPLSRNAVAAGPQDDELTKEFDL